MFVCLNYFSQHIMCIFSYKYIYFKTMNFAAVTIYHKDIIFNLLLVCRQFLAINCLHNTMKKKLDVNLWVRIIYYSFHAENLKREKLWAWRIWSYKVMGFLSFCSIYIKMKSPEISPLLVSANYKNRQTLILLSKVTRKNFCLIMALETS